jgi:integrase
MSFRSGQKGTVVRKGQMWHGRYYVDVPGQEKRRFVSKPIGPVSSMTKPKANRELLAMLEEIGLNKDNHLERIEKSGRTFADEAAWWRENKLALYKPSCQETMGSHLDKYLLPQFGKLPLAAINQRAVQEFVAKLARTEYKRVKTKVKTKKGYRMVTIVETIDPAVVQMLPQGVRRKLSPKTVENIVGVLKMILGKKVWEDWNLTLPEIPEDEQRCFSPDEMRRIVNAATGQWKVLFATMASTGMRCGEVFGLHIDDLDLVNDRIYVRRSVWNGQEVSPKTKSGTGRKFPRRRRKVIAR